MELGSMLPRFLREHKIALQISLRIGGLVSFYGYWTDVLIGIFDIGRSKWKKFTEWLGR